MIHETALETMGELYGKKITEVQMGGNGNQVRITLDDVGTLILYNCTDCCEVRSMETDDDLVAFTGAEFLGVDAKPGIKENDSDGYSVHETEFLDVKTSLGVFTVTSHNTHNGYYSGFSLRAYLE